MRLTFADMTKKVNVFNLERQPHDMNDQSFKINLKENLSSKYSEEIELDV